MLITQMSGVAKKKKWQRSYGSALLINSLSTSQNSLPYILRREMLTQGKCKLGIRIYVKDLADLNSKKLKPLIFLHGGAF